MKRVVIAAVVFATAMFGQDTAVVFWGHGTGGDTILASAVEYSWPGATSLTGTARSAVFPTAADISDFHLELTNSQNAGGTLDCVAQINGITDTTLQITVTNAMGQGIHSDTTGAISVSAGDKLRIACTNNYSGGVSANIMTFSVKLTFPGGGGGIPTQITVADTTDTTAFVALFESATGDLGPKTDAGLTYNAGTGMLTATGLTGPLTGNASTATALATNPAPCSAGMFVKDFAADGTLDCDTPAGGGSGDLWSKEFIAAASQAGSPTGAFSWRSSNAPTPHAFDASDYAFGTLIFPNAQTTNVYGRLTLPGSYSTIRMRVVGFSPATSGNVVMQLSTVCIAASEAFTGSYTATDSVTIAVDGTANEKMHGTDNLTLTGCAVDETLMFKLFRDPTHGSDTATNDFELMSLVLDSI